MVPIKHLPGIYKNQTVDDCVALEFGEGEVSVTATRLDGHLYPASSMQRVVIGLVSICLSISIKKKDEKQYIQ